MTDEIRRPSGGAPRSRVVAAVGAVVNSVMTDETGAERNVSRAYARGETAVLSPAEEARLDALGVLAPEGWTAEQVQRDVVRRADEWARGLAGGAFPGAGLGPTPPDQPSDDQVAEVPA
ncbi:MAG: hypothetical protein QOH72_5507 [Solirubrobacteraceae bacterium]|jgi:hypothetical protein|nr:hypothetical protein [Solirubrobacteraceae bacterium]